MPYLLLLMLLRTTAALKYIIIFALVLSNKRLGNRG